MADVATIAKDNGFDTAFKEWLDSSSGISIKKSAFSGKWTIPDEDVDAAVQGFQDYLSVLKKQREMELMEEEKKRKAIASMLVSSGFNFEGYSIVKYSGYISGDDVVQVDRSKGILYVRPLLTWSP